MSDPRGWLNYTSQTLGNSLLYQQLRSGMNTDGRVQELLDLLDQDQPNLILFFSIINFLVLNNPQDPFAEFYPYLNPKVRPASEAYPYFHNFCVAHEPELRNLLPHARLQTNEVTRCANLVPAFALVYQYGGCKPLAGIELGASAGLNLNWDRYHYIYNTSSTIGDESSPVQIHCTLQGISQPSLPHTLPPVASRVGMELFPLDLKNERDVNWVRACIWPEEIWRYQCLDAALALARTYPPNVLAGDACELLPDILETVPADQTICIWHSFALNQGPAYVRERIEQFLTDFSRKRTIFRISLEVNPANPDLPYPKLEIYTYRLGAVSQSEWLATCALHGEHMEWHATAPQQ